MSLADLHYNTVFFNPLKYYGPRNCVTNLARPGIMCPFHESSRRSDGSVLDDGKDY